MAALRAISALLCNFNEHELREGIYAVILYTRVNIADHFYSRCVTRIRSLKKYLPSPQRVLVILTPRATKISREEREVFYDSLETTKFKFLEEK